MSTLRNIRYQFSRLNALEIVIAITVAIYLFGALLNLILQTSGSLNVLRLPRDVMEFLYGPWTILTYGFVHYGFFHIVFNMLVLYFVSRIMFNILKPKMALGIYFLGIIAGGLLFLMVYNLLPDSLLNPAAGLVGASAGVRALLIFVCAYMPHTEVRLAFWNVKLLYLGMALVLIDVIGLFGINQGGNVAHMGGSFLGYCYAVQLQKGNDLGAGLGRLMDWVENLFKAKKRSPLKTVYKGAATTVAGHDKEEFKEFNKQKQIDLILDKIGKSGYESLTKEEKAFLFKVGKE